MNKGNIRRVAKRDIMTIENQIDKLGIESAMRSKDAITRRAAITILL